MPPTSDGDFRAFLDEKFGRVADALENIREALRQQESNRAAQFASLEARYKIIEMKVEASDGRMKVVASISAALGGVVGAVAAWIGHYILQLPK